MPAPLAPPLGPGPLRRLANILLAGLGFVLALAMGLALFLPWDIIWPQVLARATTGTPRVSLGWRSLENASALGFTLRGLSLNATGMGPAEAESVSVRLGATPLQVTGLTAHARQNTIHLDQARLELGFSPMAVLHLTAGEELILTLIRDHTVVVGGGMDLAKLLPGSRLAGTVGFSADVSWQDWGHPPVAGSAELSAQAITLPDGRTANGLNAAVNLEGNTLTLREFRMEQPVPLRGRGTATLAWGSLLTSGFEFTGVAYPGTLDQEIRRQGRLYELGQQ
jgi:hypothetical protein